MSSFLNLPKLDGELWLAKRLGEHGAGVFDGVTDHETRRERFRRAILEHALWPVIAGSRDGKCETYAAVFERLYGERLGVSRETNSKLALGVP